MKIIMLIKKWLEIAQKLFKQVEPVVAEIEQEVKAVKKAAKPKSKPKKTA